MWRDILRLISQLHKHQSIRGSVQVQHVVYLSWPSDLTTTRSGYHDCQAKRLSGKIGTRWSWSSSTADMYSCSEYGDARITCKFKKAFNLPYAAVGSPNSAASRAPYFLGATVLLEDPAGHVSELPTFSGVLSLQAYIGVDGVPGAVESCGELLNALKEISCSGTLVLWRTCGSFALYSLEASVMASRILAPFCSILYKLYTALLDSHQPSAMSSNAEALFLCD